MISQKLRDDFPLLQKHPDLIYLDSASTSLKPAEVIEEQNRYYEELGSNTGRGSHHLSQKATEEYENSREEVAKFIRSENSEIVFTRNATESINLAAVGLERMGHFSAGDEIVISQLEHHANLIPWQQLCKRAGLKFKQVKLNSDYTLDMDDLEQKITKKTKLVSIAHVANTVGTISPAAQIAKIAHEKGALFFLDSCQSIPHMEVDIKKIDADFCAFSAHKMLGPTGIGALYGRKEILDKMPPYNFGGGMISKVEFEKTQFAAPPSKFEAGTAPIAQAFGFAQSCRYLRKVGMENIHDHETKLTEQAIQKMSEIEGIKLHCPQDAKKQGAIALFDPVSIDAVDFGVALDESANIAIRTGMHCAEPLVSSINPKGLCRASFYLYNSRAEIDTFCEQVMAICSSFK
ncbi:MAG TPA: cysteine desulfurase [archaeon]|nr:cysteine desulfurase [archaeon]